MATFSHCRSCGAPIYWLKYEQSGKLAPIDVKAVRSGNIIVNTSAGTYSFAGRAEREQHATLLSNNPGPYLHTNHFMTCPNAKQHRKEAS